MNEFFPPYFGFGIHRNELILPEMFIIHSRHFSIANKSYQTLRAVWFTQFQNNFNFVSPDLHKEPCCSTPIRHAIICKV